MSNIAEGQSRRTTREYLQFLQISFGSLAEVRCQLYVALDVGYLTQNDFDRLQNDADEVGRLLSGLITSLEKKRPSP
jgi:four helix bundle protein